MRYLAASLAGKTHPFSTDGPPSDAVLVQDAFNLLPNLNVDKLARSFAVKSNDMMLVIYLSSMVRSVLALHDLIDNREGEACCTNQSVHHLMQQGHPQQVRSLASSCTVFPQ